MTTKRALVCAPVPPEFDRESGSRRIYHMIQFLREAGWAVTFMAQNEAGGGRHMRMLRQQGVATYNDGDRQIDSLLAVGQFDLAIVAFWYLAAAYLPKIRTISPATRVLVDSIDLHFLRQARHRLKTPRDGNAVLGDDYAREMVGEINAYAAADAVMTVSQKEADLLNDFLSGPVAHAVPDCEALSPLSTTFKDRRGILFLGNFRHPPNIDALEYLTGQITPRLGTALTTEHPIYVVGNGVTEAVTKACQQVENIRLIGWVPSVIPYFERARVTVVPLRYGAGTKRKLIQALMLGTPSVTTSIGAEGFDLRSGRDTLIADDPDSFANAITRLLHDARLWRALSNQGQVAVRQHDRGNVKARFLAVLDDLLSQQPIPMDSKSAHSGQDSRLQEYAALVNRVRDIVKATVPGDKTLLIVSKGDENLVKFADRAAWHFPRNGKGYAGHYPTDSDAAIKHLESLRAQGAEYLVFPQTAFWWLNHYAALKQYLETTGQPLHSNADCIIYRLVSNGNGSARHATRLR